MKDRISPTFIVAGVVIGLSCFVLLSMLFYDTGDYYDHAESAAQADGLRFSVANAFFRSLGIGAYFGWAIILAWAVIVFFREQVGDLALRGASLVVVVVSGAAVASLIVSKQHGGDLGMAVGEMLSTGLGTTLGVIVMLGIFAASFLHATDYGFFRYVRQAREAVAVMEETEIEVDSDEPVEDKPDDWSKLIDRAVTEVAKEPEAERLEAEIPEGVPADMEPEDEAEATTERDRLVLTFQSPIETEDLDEDLLVSDEKEDPIATSPAPAGEVETEEEPDDLLASVEAPEMEEAEEEAKPADTVFLDDDILMDEEIAETAREMLEALGGTVEVEEIEETVEVAVDEAETEEVEAGEEEESPPLAAIPETEAMEAETVEPEAIETEWESVITETAPEPVKAEVEAEPEPVEEEEPATAPAPGDVDSVFDALLGPAVVAVKEVEETPPAPVVEAAPAPVAAPVAVEAEEEYEEPGFILTDDVIVIAEDAEEGETADAEAAPETETVVEAVVEAAPVVTPEPVVPAQEERGDLEEEILSEMEEEFTGEVFEEQVILVDERLDIPSAAEIEEEEAPLLPFMEEPETETAPAPVETEEPAKPEIPVLEDVADAKKPNVLRSLFGKKDATVKRPGDPLLDEAALLVIEKGRASVVFLQRRLDIGYTRASRLIDAMERNGLVGPLEESGSREVLMTVEEWETARG